MGNSGSTIASNTVSNVVNSLTSIVNNTAMVCVNEFKSLQAIVLEINAPAGTNVLIDQNIVAQVGTECVTNASTVAEASTNVYQEISQIAEAIMKGGRGSAEAHNITQMVTNLATTIINTYTSECSNSFVNQQAIVAKINLYGKEESVVLFPTEEQLGADPFPGDQLDADKSVISINQSADLEFVGECLLKSTSVLTASTTLEQIIEQYAKAEQSSVMGQIAFLLIAIALVLFVIFHFGRRFLSSGSIFGLIFVILWVVISILILYAGFEFIEYLFGLAPEREQDITPYDLGKWKETLDGEGFECNSINGLSITRVGGFTSCVNSERLMKPEEGEDNIYYPGYERSTKDNPVGTYSLNCPNDTYDFHNLGSDSLYFNLNKQFLYPERYGANLYGSPSDPTGRKYFEDMDRDGVQTFLDDLTSPGIGLCCEFDGGNYSLSNNTMDYVNPFRCVNTETFYQTVWQKTPENKARLNQPTVDNTTGGYAGKDPYIYDPGAEFKLEFDWSEVGNFLSNTENSPDYNAFIDPETGKILEDGNYIIGSAVKNYMRSVLKNGFDGEANGIYSDSIYNKLWYGRDGVFRHPDLPAAPIRPISPYFINLTKKAPVENLRSYSCWNGNEEVTITGDYPDPKGNGQMYDIHTTTRELLLDSDNVNGTRQCVYNGNKGPNGFACIEFENNGELHPSMCCAKSEPTRSNTECIYNVPTGDPYTCDAGTLTSICDYCLNFNEKWDGTDQRKAQAAQLCYRYLLPTPSQQADCYWTDGGVMSKDCNLDIPQNPVEVERTR